MADAWFCPGCRKYHAPHVETCPGPAEKLESLFPFTPFHPKPGSAGDVPCANCKGTCGNAACPKRMIISTAAQTTWGDMTGGAT